LGVITLKRRKKINTKYFMEIEDCPAADKKWKKTENYRLNEWYY
jgi:hypothetical protein